MPRPSRVERLFRSLLRVFPAEFRGDFGDQMSADFQDQYHDARAFGGRRTLARLWARTVIDALKRGPREHLDVLARDAGYAWRLLRRRPGLAASALLTLTIGIGLNTAVFSVVSGVLWRELAIPGGDRIVRIYEVAPPPESKAGSVSPANFLDWRSQARTLDELAAVGGGTANLVGGVDPEEIGLARVSAGFFRMAPARPLFGRLFNDADYALLEAAWQARDSQVPFSRPGVLLGHELWMRQFLGRATASRRQILWLAGLFSLMSVALALVGVYSVMAESVAQRVPEIGVRMALGATTADIVRLIVRQGGTMAVLGIGGGLVGAYALNRVMAGFVFRVPTTDPATYFFASAVLVAATLAACGVPARRAARVDPVLALRHE
jgi:MacB-like periplasmic core domain/FtsX-like permease family